MRIAFFDFADWDYTIDAAYERPLGGSQSALCYLCESLAAAGHDVWLLNHVAQPVITRGVRCVPVASATPQLLHSFDCAVVLNTVRQGAQLRGQLASGTPLILWIQHAHDQPASGVLRHAEIREAFDAFALVSRWQRERFVETFDLAANRCMTLRNAVGPRFQSFLDPSEPLPPEKLWPPSLAYTSTPFRGLDLLLAAFPAIRAVVPEVTLQVFSSLRVYQATAEEDVARFGALYEQCRATEGVTYHGSVPQPELAEQLRRCTMLAYPNHFAETSCIAVLEAMAAGCRVVTSDLGALSETGQGFAQLIPVDSDWNAYTQEFVNRVVGELRDLRADPARYEQSLTAQVAAMQLANHWPLRAQQWATWLEVVTLARHAQFRHAG